MDRLFGLCSKARLLRIEYAHFQNDFRNEIPKKLLTFPVLGVIIGV